MNFILFLLAMLPILWLIFAMLVLKWPAALSAFSTAILAAVMAFFAFHTPVATVGMSALEGICMALWPIVLVIIAAVFTYNLVKETGNMDVISNFLMSITKDRRILVLLIAWCFGGFMEGMAGFGTAIAIPAGMLVALGFDPVMSCLVCLIANSVPTAWGSIGIPTVTLANLVGFNNAIGLSTMQSIQAAVFMILIPVIIIVITGKGFKAMKGLWPLALVSGLSFVIPMLAVSYFLGAELVMVAASICSLICTGLMAKTIKPNPEYEMDIEVKHVTMPQLAKAAAPFGLIVVFLLLTSNMVPPVAAWLNQFTSTIVFVPDTAGLSFKWINTPGIWIFLSAIIGAFIQKAGWNTFKNVFIATLKQMKNSVIVMLSVLAAAKIMIYSGMIEEISAFVIAATGSFYPLLAPWLGALGTFVTGSGTSSSVLFGQVQMDAATSLHMDPYWIVGLNSIGVGVGKMLSPQSISIALSAVTTPDKPAEKGMDSLLFQKALPYAALFIILMSLIGYFGAVLIG